MAIGLTGGIATGKSTVLRIFAERPTLETFDADACVHRLLESSPEIAEEIGRIFGPEFLGADGKPDRSALRHLVFGDAGARRRLENLLHPLVRAEWQTHQESCALLGRDFLPDIPLLYETGAEEFFDRAVVVACSPELQRDRLRSRGIDPDTAQAMLASQLPIGQKMDRASFVIWNDGSLASLGRQTELVANQLFHD